MISAIASQGVSEIMPTNGIQGLQFSSNSSSIIHVSCINACSVIPFDFQYASPSGPVSPFP